MVKTDTAHVCDLRPGDWVGVHCSCGHDTFLPPYVLVQGFRLEPEDPVAVLTSRLRCPECGGLGQAVVSIE